jgi:sarcosine oxidase
VAGRVTRTVSICLYTNTPDGHFVLDRHPTSDRVYIVSACSGHGFKFAPAIGEAVASEMTERPVRWDLAPFRLGRLARATRPTTIGESPRSG